MNHDFDDAADFLIDQTRDLEFSFKDDPTVAYIRRALTPDDEEYVAKLQPEEYNVYEFAKQFMQWGQVVDTDYENYFVFWSCWESGEWYKGAQMERV